MEKKGQTLIEVAIALFVLSVAIVSLWSVFAVALRLMETTRANQWAEQAVENVMAELRSFPDFGKIYLHYGKYDGSSGERKFYIQPDLSVVWGEVPKEAIGEGYLEFVTSERGYDPLVWGTGTAFSSGGEVIPGGIDLNGDGHLDTGYFPLGQTEGTPFSSARCFRLLPVRIFVRIYGGVGDEVWVERKGFLRP